MEEDSKDMALSQQSMHIMQGWCVVVSGDRGKVGYRALSYGLGELSCLCITHTRGKTWRTFVSTGPCLEHSMHSSALLFYISI